MFVSDLSKHKVFIKEIKEDEKDNEEGKVGELNFL